jgi:hypothetical protein
MNKTKAATDPEMAEFEAALLRSLDQTARGKGRVNIQSVQWQPFSGEHHQPSAARSAAMVVSGATGRI